MVKAAPRFYVGSMNDGLFIIDTPPRPSTDDVWYDRPDGPGIAIPMGTDAALANRLVDAWNGVLDAK